MKNRIVVFALLWTILDMTCLVLIIDRPISGRPRNVIDKAHDEKCYPWIKKVFYLGVCALSG